MWFEMNSHCEFTIAVTGPPVCTQPDLHGLQSYFKKKPNTLQYKVKQNAFCPKNTLFITFFSWFLTSLIDYHNWTWPFRPPTTDRPLGANTSHWQGSGKFCFWCLISSKKPVFFSLAKEHRHTKVIYRSLMLWIAKNIFLAKKTQ